MGKISVIIPVYNTEKYVESCLQSVTAQTYQDIEILIINDNSNETCTSLINQAMDRDSRIQVFHFQSMQGVAAARNYGITKASGDYVYFLDSDDYLPEKTLELLVNHIGNSPMIRGKIRSTNFSNGMAIILEGIFKTKIFDKNRYNLIKNSSALNFLFKKSFVFHNELQFAEDVHLYSDLAFMVPALLEVEEIPFLKEAIYFKRRRNDPIRNPSLSQQDTEMKIKSFLQMYNTLKNKYGGYEIAADYLDTKLLNFYRKDIVTFFQDENHISKVFLSLTDAMRKVNTFRLKKYNWVLKNEVRTLSTGNIKKYKRINKRHQNLRDARKGVKTKQQFNVLVYKKLFMKMSMKNNLVFIESFSGKSYSDNPKYIYQYMLNQNMEYNFVWGMNEKKNIPGNPKQIPRLSLRYFYYLARARYWISNVRMPGYLDKRDGNVFLQTWHGTPLKRLATDMDEVQMPGTNTANYKLNFLKESSKWDYLISPNQYSSDIFRRAFQYDNRMLEFGYPRNDILYQKNTESSIAVLKNKMALPEDKKIVLYAPTWRDDEFYSRGNYKFRLQLDLEKMQRQLGDEYVVVLRMHYLIASQMDISDFTGFAYDFSDYDDVAELYLVSDILITDYSSVFFDYANLKRPILFFTYDLDKYRDQLRGFYIDIEKELPGPLVKTTDEIIDSIENIDDIQETYQEQYNAFFDRFCKWDDGHASENIVKSVFYQ